MKRILMTLLILLSLTACSLPGLGGSAEQNDVVIASGNTTERQIMAEMIANMVRHYEPDMNVDILTNLGSSILIQQAILRNDANISSVMYTGTSLTGELAQEATTDVEKAFWTVVEGYSEQFDMVWFPSYGFDNTYAFMVSKDFAQEHDLKTISDMEKMADDLRAGIDTGWIDRDGDGYEAFKELYGFDFGNVSPMEIGLVYNAIQSGDMDVVLGYSTDGRIDAYDLVVLEDDLQLFPPYDASPVVAKSLLEAHPELETIMLKLEEAVQPEDMQALNRKSDEMKIEPQVVALEYLEENNYFEDVNPEPLKSRDRFDEILKDLYKEGEQ